MEFFWKVWGVFPDLLLDHDYPGRHTGGMFVKLHPHRTALSMAILLFAAAFCGHADAALHLGIEDAASSCAPVADTSTPDEEVEQSSDESGIAVCDAGNSNSTSQCIRAESQILIRGQGLLVRRPESRLKSLYFRDPLDQVPRL